jgi:hypothetical protein
VVNWDKLLGLTVMTRDGRVCPVRQVLAVSTNYDLAIVQVEGTGFTPLPVAPYVRHDQTAANSVSFGKVVFLRLPSGPGCGLVPEIERA